MRKKPQQNNGGNLITNYFGPEKGSHKNGTKAHGGKNQQQTKIDYHQSSMEGQADSKTQILQSDKEKSWIESRPEEVCLQLAMIAPFDTTYYKGFKRRVKELRNNYDRERTIKFIQENAKYEGATNLRNLQKIEDAEFWNTTVPLLLNYVDDDKKQKTISCKLRMLTPNKSQILSISKAQVFMVLLNMFFCIFPKQTNRKTSHYTFLHLMTITDKDGEAISSTKLEKLKCIINYLKVMSKRKYKDLQNHHIQYQRCVSEIESAQYRNIEYQMKEVEVKVGFVQESYQYDIIVDFANKNIGGGVLNRGAVQEEILFCVFPELIFTLAVSFELKSNQSIIVYGAEKFNLYQGYSDTFKFVGSFNQKPSEIGPFKSIIVAVDATDFKTSSYREHHQYQATLIERELEKFLGGIRGADYGADERMRVCTGKWGCGAFGGDLYLKFIIQWIACSMANKDMIFTCQKEEKHELQVLIRFLRKFDSLELLEIIEEYASFQNSNRQFSFIDFIKKYCS